MPTDATHVILHCDLDCFYAQVERERLHLPHDAAVAVVQWGSALAVSYPARKFGIKRGSRADEITRLSGATVTIVPVETISSASASASVLASGGGSTPVANDHAKATQKVSLARYRTASARVFAAIAAALDGTGATVERASIDEAYIDVTREVHRRAADRLCRPPLPLPADTAVVGGDLHACTSAHDALLAYGAQIAAEIRHRVRRDCAYTMSAGVSFNKLLAKFASATNKPNKQTIVPHAAVADFLRDVPLGKLRGLGGKLGKDVQALGVSTAGEATRLSKKQLVDALQNDKAAEFVFNCVRGIDATPVKPRDLPMTILAAKSFSPENTLAVVHRTWLPVLAEELVDRLDEDSQLNDRNATTLTVTFRAKAAATGDWVTASRSLRLPHGPNVQSRQAAVMKSASALLHDVLVKGDQFRFPVSMIGLTACNFVERAAGKERITNFFANKPTCLEEPHNLPRNPSGANGVADHKKRLQEKADRQLALKLHREQSAIRKPRHSSKSSASPHPRGTVKRKPGSGNALKGVRTVDNFFRRRV